MHCLDYLAIVAVEAGIDALRAEILSRAERELSPDYDEIAAWPERAASLVRLRAELRPFAEPAVGSDLGEALDKLVWERLTVGEDALEPDE